MTLAELAVRQATREVQVYAMVTGIAWTAVAGAAWLVYTIGGEWIGVALITLFAASWAHDRLAAARIRRIGIQELLPAPARQIRGP